MAIKDDEVATLRAHLAGDFEEYQRLWAELPQDAKETTYTALLAAAFCEAVERRFSKKTPDTDVIEFVAAMRARFDPDGTQIDPRAAERMIKAVYTDEEIDDLGTRTVVSLQVAILTALITDEQLDSAALDAFMAKARADANDWTS